MEYQAPSPGIMEVRAPSPDVMEVRAPSPGIMAIWRPIPNRAEFQDFPRTAFWRDAIARRAKLARCFSSLHNQLDTMNWILSTRSANGP